MSHSPATPSEWEPEADTTRPLPVEGEADAEPGAPDAPREDAWPNDPDAQATEVFDVPGSYDDEPGAEPGDADGTPSRETGLEPGDADAPVESQPVEADAEETTPAGADDQATEEFFAFEPEATAVLDSSTEPLLVPTPDEALADDLAAGTAAEPGAGDPAGPGTPGAAPEAAEDGSGGNRRPLMFLIAGLAVLLVIGGIVWAVIATGNANRDRAIADTANRYLQALSTNDAQGALATLSEKPTNTALLTGEVLGASNAAAPLTDIAVTEPVFDGGSAATVKASYKLGGEPVSTTLHLVGDGRTQWLLADGTSELTLTSPAAATINNAKVTESTNPVFPGTYKAAEVTPNIALEGTPTAVIAAPDSDPATLALTPTLSEAGTSAVRETVQARLNECLAATESRPADCPIGIDTSGVEVAPGSVKFALANDPWAGFAPTLDAATLKASGQLPLVVDVTATVTANGLTTDATQRLEATRTYTVDLTQNPLAVVWS